jgi:hypothetical protein
VTSDDKPRPLPAAILDADGVRKVGEGAPSPGTAGRMELLRIWDGLARDDRRGLLELARRLYEETKARER